MSIEQFIQDSDRWLKSEGPRCEVVVSSRARYARNLRHLSFAPRASNEHLRDVLARIDEALSKCSIFEPFCRLTVSDINSLLRRYLKESHLISNELEQGGEYRVIYISPDYRISIMINEEDHLRMQCLDVGLQLPKVLAILDEVETELGRVLDFAYHPRFGYLTACPTNVGSGLRLSVMLHMPGLTLVNKVKETMNTLSEYGLTVRGIYGEHTENLGDYYQVSNEVTLGRSPAETRETLQAVTEQLVEKELRARNELFEQKPMVIRDLLSRALGTLKNAWIMESAESLAHLSKIRLGIDRGWFSKEIHHSDLSHLMVQVMPAHLQAREKTNISTERRDIGRAELLQERLRDINLTMN